MKYAEVLLKRSRTIRKVRLALGVALGLLLMGLSGCSQQGEQSQLNRVPAEPAPPSKDIKDKQINFYHRALAEFRDFNEAWRKHMAHAHDGAFYDRDQALSILKHVKDCMRVLSCKISELTTTPLYWTTP